MEYRLAMGMVLRRISSLGACSDSDSVTGRSSSANLSMFGTRPQVDSDTLRMPMHSPPSMRRIRRNLTTLS